VNPGEPQDGAFGKGLVPFGDRFMRLEKTWKTPWVEKLLSLLATRIDSGKW
jgi:hypothetical protein